MDEKNFLAEQFERERSRLRAVAYRMLGSQSEAEDAVQEAWLRLNRSDAGTIGNLGGWLTTVTARVCLDMLRSRKSRREDPIDQTFQEPTAEPDNTGEREQWLADSIGLALLVVLDRLAPAERVAFVLHDMFDLPFDTIAPIVERTPAATRQLASRARRRVQGANAANTDTGRQHEIVDAFLTASREGNLERLLALLDPDVVFRADQVAAKMGGITELRGNAAVAATFKGRAQAAKPALIDGTVGVAVILQGSLKIVLSLTFAGDRIAGIEAIADPARIAKFNVDTSPAIEL
jgi:RNA polymerase sigma-70 factor (ECF subfamily)